MRVGFGNDHVAVELKNILMGHLKEKGYECIDFGTKSPAEKVNYPEARASGGGKRSVRGK